MVGNTVSALSGTTAAAQERATLGMGMIAGTTVMLLTLIWGSSILLGSYDLSQANTTTTAATTTDNSPTQKKSTTTGVVTDIETSYTARIMLISLVPFLILIFAIIFNSTSGRRAIVLVALIVTVALLVAYVVYQVIILQPFVFL